MAETTNNTNSKLWRRAPRGVSQKPRGKKYKKAWKQTWTGFKTNLPIFLWILLLIAIIQQYIPLSFLGDIKNPFLASFLANFLGSISAWNPVNSYIIASEFGSINFHWYIIAVFLSAWITVGFIQIPAESYYFGKKYAILRNILAFLFCFLVGFLVYFLYLNL